VKRSFPLLLSVAGAVLVLDQLTKRWAVENLAHHTPVEVLGPLLRFTYTRNSGVAFGLGAGLPFPYYLFSIVAVVAILYLFLRRTEHTFPRQLSLALILGGAIGNLVDRLASGEVVDFIEIGWGHWHWPVFNIADTAVTIGVVLFGLTWSHATHTPAPAADGGDDGAPGKSEGRAHDPDAGTFGSASRRGAAGSLPGDGSGGPLS